MTAFNWEIVNLERETSDGYVFKVHYTVSAEDSVYTAKAYGSLGLERPDGQLIPFSRLTKELVTDWVKGDLGAEKVAEIEARLQRQLDEQHAPSKAAGVPWAA